MRRLLLGVLIATSGAALPARAQASDREIAKNVLAELENYKRTGQLKGFDINLRVEEGVVYLTGEVANRSQRSMIAEAASRAVGGDNVVNKIKVPPAESATVVLPVSGSESAEVASQRDMQITDTIFAHLAQAKSAGTLRGFDLDISTISGDVWLRGKVTHESQKTFVLEVARCVEGVTRVIDDITVTGTNPIRTVSTGGSDPLPLPAAPMAVPPTPMPMAPNSSMPMMAVAPQHQQAAVQAVPHQFVGHRHAVGHQVGGPVPMQYAGAEMGMGAPRYDQPHLPNYAWPSYAAYPNYAAVTYPKQYSPSAWPYIGPFYPYPQVPLGWRKVNLQWDDGLWYLDFTSK